MSGIAQPESVDLCSVGGCFNSFSLHQDSSAPHPPNSQEALLGVPIITSPCTQLVFEDICGLVCDGKSHINSDVL